MGVKEALYVIGSKNDDIGSIKITTKNRFIDRYDIGRLVISRYNLTCTMYISK
jgi:hypothetical protein